MREAEVVSHFGVPPRLVAELQALIGDRSDNIRGVRISPQQAAALLNQYGSLEAIVQRAETIESNSVRRKIQSFGAERFGRNLAVTSLQRELPIPASFFSFRDWRDPLGVLHRKKLDVQILQDYLKSQGLRRIRIPHWYRKDLVLGSVEPPIEPPSEPLLHYRPPCC